MLDADLDRSFSLTGSQVCSGDCVEFDTHVPAAKALIEQHGADKTSRKFFEQRLAW